MSSAEPGSSAVQPAAVPQGTLSKVGFEEEALPCLDAVYRFALRLSRGNEAEAADIVQETFLRAYRGWHTYERGTRIHSWLFTICRNLVRRRTLQAESRPEVSATDLGGDGDHAAAGIASPLAGGPRETENRFFDGLVDRTVLRAIDALPDEFRESVILKDMHDLTCAEIAAMLGISEGTVKSRLHRGRKILARALRDYAVEIGFIAGTD